MGKSYKSPYWTDNGTSGEMKKKTNRKFRRNAKDVGDNGDYKKQYESWDICDYSFHDPKNPKAYRK